MHKNLFYQANNTFFFCISDCQVIKVSKPKQRGNLVKMEKIKDEPEDNW